MPLPICHNAGDHPVRRTLRVGVVATENRVVEYVLPFQPQLKINLPLRSNGEAFHDRHIGREGTGITQEQPKVRGNVAQSEGLGIA